MKYCPQCGCKVDNAEINFCPDCAQKGDRVKLKTVQQPQKDSAGNTGGVNIGMGGVVGGPIIYSTKDLSEAERIAKNKAAYREECERRCKDGFISQEDQLFLDKYRDDLGLEKHFADEILKRAREQSVRRITTLPGPAKLQVEQTIQAIAANDIHTIKKDLAALEQYKSKIDVDELDQLYYQLKAILAPESYVIKDEDYWSHFWSFIVYRRQDSPKADEVIASLHKWDSFKPAENQTLLFTIGLLMQNRLEEAKSSFKAVSTGFSSDLQPLYEAVDNLIGREWYGKTADVPPRFKFYVDSLFKKAYETLKARAKANQADILEREAAERQKRAQEENRRQKFLEILKSNNGNITAACDASGISKSLLVEWRGTIPGFDEDIESILNSAIEKKRLDEQKAMREAEEAKQLAETKDCFKKRYESNSCDALKTCAELGLDSGTVQQWRRDDSSFDEALHYIERLHAEIIRKAECERRMSAIKKMLPWILIALLVVAGILGIVRLSHNRADKKAQTEAILQEAAEKERLEGEYELAISNFNLAFSSVNTSSEGLDALANAANALKQIIALEQDSHLGGRKDSEELIILFKDKVKDLLEHFKALSALTPEKGGTDITRKDGEEGQKRVRRILNSLQI